MKQQDFEDRHAAQWRQLEQWLDNGRARGRKLTDFPRCYRQLCHQLAIARHRQYGSFLIERLNRLVTRCHHHLYGGSARRRGIWLKFFVRDFPRVLYLNRRLIAVAALLFFGTAIVMGLSCYRDNTLVYSVMAPTQVRQLDAMYDPTLRELGRIRQSDTDLMMFGFYIKHNIGISFRSYAGGLVFGLGTLFSVIFNGVSIGAVAGYITQQGFAATFWPFVIGHGAFELTALVLSGAAGLRLGRALLDPGRFSRLHALRIAGSETATLMLGVTLMLCIAAFLEAFWSSSTALPIATKLGVGAMLWLLVLTYLVGAARYAGRFEAGREVADAA